MTKIVVPRCSSAVSSSNPSRPSSLSGPSSVRVETQQLNPAPQVSSAVKDEEIGETADEHVTAEEKLENCGSVPSKAKKSECQVIEGLNGDHIESLSNEFADCEFVVGEESVNAGDFLKGLDSLKILDESGDEATSVDYIKSYGGILHPPPHPIQPPRPLSASSSLTSTNSARVGSSRRAAAWPVVSTRVSPTGSRPSSPRFHVETEGYNSSDEQNPCLISYNDLERERQFEIDIRRAKGLEIKKMLEDGNCLFRAVADQVYGDSEAYDLVRQMCLDYMERERDHFSQFITEGFTSYCKRKRRDKVYGNNVEIQALSEMYNRPIHIYSYSIEPINMFQGSYRTDTPPIRLSYHLGNHYNSLVNQRCLAIGAGLGFSTLRGANVDKDQVKAAIKAQQDQQIENALVAEGKFYSDIELTEKEMERMVMEASRFEYLAWDRSSRGCSGNSSSTCGAAEPSSSSGERASGSEMKKTKEESVVSSSSSSSSSIQIVLSMGFSYLQVMEVYSIFGDDVDSMVCYLIETSSSSTRWRKGKAAE